MPFTHWTNLDLYSFMLPFSAAFMCSVICDVYMYLIVLNFNSRTSVDVINITYVLCVCVCVCVCVYGPIHLSMWCHSCPYYLQCAEMLVIVMVLHVHVITIDCLCGLVIRVPGGRPRGSRLKSQRYQIFWVAVGLEWGPLSLMSINEELLERESSGYGLENWD
jgi:hypothetical protein